MTQSMDRVESVSDGELLDILEAWASGDNDLPAIVV
jgi:hypothetical protein